MANLTLRSNLSRSLTHAELDGNFEYFTGSIDAINDATGSFLTSADTGSFLTAAQTASLNISDTLYTVNSALSASGTTQSTTSVCSYGVNVFEYVTTTNRATKLPQPTTGKSVKIINNSTTFLYVYPSNVGGRVNNYPVDTPAILPPDGNLHEFICIKNPLPGEWTWSEPATGQYDSGEIEISMTSIGIGSNPWVTAIDSTKYGRIVSSFLGQWAFDGKNKPAQIIYPAFNIGGDNPASSALPFRPETPWKGISKIKVYTNILSTVDEGGDPISGGEIRLNAAGESDYYDISTGYNITNGENNQKTLFRIYPNKVISGTPVTGSTQYTSANIGDPGTLWTEKVAFADSNSNVNLDGGSVNTNVQGTFIGNKTQGQIPFPFSGTPGVELGDTVEKFYSSYISFQYQPLSYVNYGTIPDLKFRFIIEYYQ